LALPVAAGIIGVAGCPDAAEALATRIVVEPGAEIERVSRSQPVRIFSVTGTASGPMPTAPTTASTIRCTNGSFCSKAEPAATLHTFLAGQPMLMSMICAPFATL